MHAYEHSKHLRFSSFSSNTFPLLPDESPSLPLGWGCLDLRFSQPYRLEAVNLVKCGLDTPHCPTLLPRGGAAGCRPQREH
jgi:hypothetical protein